jgi:hydroxymethylpyrimidine/phosphomethylpyrimidine kinase
MSGSHQPPRVVTVAGSDPSGGAGLQADLRVMALHGLFGTAVVTALTVQDSRGVHRVEPVPGELVGEQLRALLAEGTIAAMKTGMLGSAAAVAAVADALAEHDPSIPLVVDPVMVSSSGRSLLEAAGVAVLRERLLPLATVITPNLDEAAVLLECGAIAPGEGAAAARALSETLGTCVVVKGGHAPGAIAIDYVSLPGTSPGSGAEAFRLEAPWVATPHTHGSGCLFSAALCAALARGDDLRDALGHARRCMDRGLLAAREGQAGPGCVWLDRLPGEG